jgi:prepilin-type N-terminal cleavage/methylation domain-containing protein
MKLGHLRRGFTLIELLVVIAIIGILSSVVLASLNTARNKGNDASVKSNLSTIHTQAELAYDTNGNKYGTAGIAAGQDCVSGTGVSTSMFATDSTIKAAIAAANSASGGQATCYMDSAGQNYVVWAPLKTSGQYWCIDSGGSSKQESTVQGSNTTCP